MKVYLYCSYSGSPMGYQEKCINTETGEKTNHFGNSEVGKRIDRLFTHGGASSVLGVEKNGEAYFLIKSMKGTDDSQRKWYLNFAVSSDDVCQVCALAYMAYSDYREFVSRITEMLFARDEEDSYEADREKLDKMLKAAAEKYEMFAAGDETGTISMPFELEEKHLEQVFRILKDKNPDSVYELVFLDSTEDYFYSSCGDTDRIKTGFLLGEKRYISQPSKVRNKEHQKKDDSKEHFLRILAAACAFIIGALVSVGIFGWVTGILKKTMIKIFR